MIFFSKSYMTTVWVEKQIHVPNFIAAFHNAPVVFAKKMLAENAKVFVATYEITATIYV